jgi:putative transposase
MKTLLAPLLFTLAGLLRSRALLHLEILSLRQQLAMVAARNQKRLRTRRHERLFWVWLYRLWPGCLATVAVFQPDTLLRWHQQGFRLYWTWISRRRQRPGRPATPAEIRALIRQLSRDNPLWGAPHVHGELQMLGIVISQTTVAKSMLRHRKPPSQTWRTFLDNHVTELASIDFFTVPAASFRILYVFLVLRHERRELVHFNVTEHPTAQWAAQQMVEAFPWDPPPKYVVRDRDQTYGEIFRRRVKSLGMKEVLIAPRSPWQNPYVERLIGSIRRECLDHHIILNERHLRRVLRAYMIYYHTARTHLSLGKQCPKPRPIHPPDSDNIIAFPHLGGLHHEYRRAA